jgi:tetratricopeptide (TPR) repeat protein
MRSHSGRELADSEIAGWILMLDRRLRWWHWSLAFSFVVLALVPVLAIYWRIDRWRSELALADARREVGSSRFESARDRLLGLPSWAPARDEVDYLIGVCEAALGRQAEAVEAWGRVPAGSRYAARAAVRRARLALPLGRFSVAEELTPAFDEPELAAEARQTCALVLKLEGRHAEARRVFQEGWRHMPSLVATLLEVWRLDYRPLDVELSRDELTKAGSKAPDDDRVWLGRANLATWEGRFDEASRWLRDCLRRRPADPAVWRAWLDRARAAGEPGEVWRALEHLTTADLEPAEVPMIRAWLASQAGRPDLERPALEEAVRLRPEELAAFDRLAELSAGTPEAERWRLARALVIKAAARTSELLFDDEPTRHAAELGALAETLGRRFDARCWWLLHERSHPADSLAVAARARLGGDGPRLTAPPHLLSVLLASYRPRAQAITSSEHPTISRDWPHFVDDSATAGLKFTFETGAKLRTSPIMMGGGVALLDFDGDGWLDVYCVQGGPFPPAAGASAGPGGDRLFRNRGDGTFEDATLSTGLADLPRGYGYGVAVGDVDSDGHPDLFVTRWRSYALYHNQGGRTFEDVTDRFGLGGDRDWPTSAAFADFDHDGDLDLYVCHYLKFDPANPAASSRMPGLSPTAYSPLMYPAMPDKLLRNDGDRFVDVSKEAGIVDTDGRGLGVVACDLDGDARVDVFVANDLTANALYHNQGGLRFKEIGQIAGVAAGSFGGYQAGMGIACGDLDGDGRPDLAVTNFYGESSSLFHNLGRCLFVDHTNRSGLGLASRYRLGFGTVFFDADNDGRLDLATVNGHVVDDRPSVPFGMPAQLMLGTGDGRLVDGSARAGKLWSVPQVARGLAVGDLDNDGRLDLVMVIQDGPIVFAHNQSTARHSITLKLEGRPSNRDAVGARVVVRAGDRTQTGWRTGGGSYLSASDPRLHFGIGRADRVESVEVTWPSGKVDRFAGLAADRIYHVFEGEEAPVCLFHERATPRPAPP